MGALWARGQTARIATVHREPQMPKTPTVSLPQPPARSAGRRLRWQESVALQLNAGLDALLRLPAVMHRTGMSRSMTYAWIARGTFPAPIRLAGSRVSFWRARDIAIWLELVSTMGREPDAATLRAALDRHICTRLGQVPAAGIGDEAI